ncbi:hypothetical protein HXX76_005489 [Chlamydomonas incerta]|uniref:Calponin-homology (CH) domain-containing protein n=1 Tax=Chlamydomonas incerta TaxID=51695 RepID=A0A835T2Q6_CHLIN|nr:hypothetical protein HXX76_005489 [Chlamydomonas incerta]|eukprot:KAG2437872.1 hypothetical protein HXX76_005489 [Chlamydomonas incerta]
MSVPVPHPPNFNIDQGYEYYAGKPELLDWINRLLQLNLQRLEQLTSGAVYCQVLDAFHASVVPIRKVNFHAREEYEILPNYKVLQAAFNALGFTKELAVARLSQASSSDLTEFAQWLYKSYRGAAGLPDYNPVARRQLSLKGGTNNIPFPACLNSTYFEFGRSDLRSSGTHWTTPADYVKTAPRTRSSTNTPGTGGRPMSATATQTASAAKRAMPNLNVGSRFREGLAVPPEHHRRRSPRLTPVSPALIVKVPMRDSESQTDFVDEEWRPMTEDDVGAEAVSPKPPPVQAADSASQYDFGFGYGTAPGSISPSGASALSPSSSYTPGGAVEDFTFGQHSPGASMGGAGPTAMSPHSYLTPVDEPGEGAAEGGEEDEEVASVSTSRAAPDAGFGADDALPQGFGSAGARSPSAAGASRGFGAHDASTQDEQPAQSSPGGFGSPRGFGVGDDAAVQAVADVSERGAGEFGVGDDYAAGAGSFGTSAAVASGAGEPSPAAAVVEQEAGADEYADEEFEDEEVADDVAKLGAAVGFAGAAGAAAAEAAAAEAAAAAASAAEPHATVRAMEAEGHSGDSGDADEGGRGSARAAGAAATAAGLAAGIAALDVDHDVATASEAGVTDAGEDEGQTGVPESPVAATPGPGAAAAASRSTPPPAASALAGLSPEIAQLLASPSMRSRVASAVSVRNMGSALDICAAALQAVQRSLDSYTTLMAEPRAAPAPAAAAAGSKRASGAGEEAAAGAATGGAGAAGGAADGGGAAAAWSPTLCGKVRSLQDALQTLLAHTTLLLGDVQVYSEATKSPESRSNGGSADGAASPSSAQTRDYKAEAAALLDTARDHEARLQGLVQAANEALSLPSDESKASAGAAAAAAADKAAGEPAQHHHLTDAQRRLCSTTQLDAHLKAVGMAQFALAQGIHKELALMTMSFFRHNAAMAASESGTPGGAAASGTAASRKARVFKLGEFQLKQLRNGDVYKGRYVSNKKNGEGVYHFINADVYEGEFRDDRMDGHGVYTFSHEGRYEGAWRNAVYNGTGAETFAKGSTYRGEYVGGLRNGWGVCRFYNGDYYEGQWVKGLRDGSGMQQCTDDSNFVGEYTKGKRHGHGVYSFPNGDRYEGQYSEDLPHGFGTYHFASGQCYQGQWQAGKKHGWSVYTVDNGSRFMGLWSDGKPTWVQPLAGDKAAGGTEGDAAASPSEEDAKQLKQALEARNKAAQAADLARARAASHWDQSGSVQSHILSALSRAQNSAGAAQQARRKACDLASRLDAAVALIQQQQGSVGAAATPAGTPGP